MEPVEAYQNRKESQTLEELAQIEGDVEAIFMESLVIIDRILGGADSIALLRPVHCVGMYYESQENFDICTGLYKRLMKISLCCDHEGTLSTYLKPLFVVFYKMITNGIPPRQEDLVEVLELAYLKYEKEVELRRELDDKPFHPRLTYSRRLFQLLSQSLVLLQIIAKVVRCQEDQNSRGSVFLRKLSRSNFRDEHGNTLLHLAAKRLRGFIDEKYPQPPRFPCAETMQLLLNAGFNVNAVNNDGDTPLHRAVTFTPWTADKFDIVTDMLEVLLDGGAHHDFVNNDGKTAMDMAATDDARRILSERKTLELKCIAARAVKKFGLPYSGIVPKALEKYISMH